MNDPFREWLKTEEAKRCLSWPVSSEVYLQNRLWWAFNAGYTAAVQAQAAVGARGDGQ